VGVFIDEFDESQLKLGTFHERGRVRGPYGPFNATNKNSSSVLHIFYESSNLQLHLVVLYRVMHFLWIGSIPEHRQFRLEDNLERNPNRTFVLHYGKTEQIFDPFTRISTDGIRHPDDVVHFLSQLPTSRYLHCSPEKTTQWFGSNNLTINKDRVKVTEAGLVGMKSFMRKMQMEFWIACGTLLG